MISPMPFLLINYFRRVNESASDLVKM